MFFGWRTSLTSAQWYLCAIGTALCLTFLAIFGSQHFTMTKKWQDNVSQISSTVMFWYRGIDIYRHPMTEIATELPTAEIPPKFLTDVDQERYFWIPELGKEKPMFFVWPYIPRPYPPGAWLWHAPSALMVYGLDVPLKAGIFFNSLLCIFVAHIAFMLFFNRLQEIKTSLDAPSRFWKFCYGFTLFIVYCEFMNWTMQGQYDLIAMLFVVGSIDSFLQRRWSSALFWYGIALFFHLRSLLLLGLVPLCVWQLLKSWEWLKPSQALRWGSALVLAAIGAMVFYWNSSFLTNSELFPLNHWHYSVLGKRHLWELIVVPVTLISIFYYWIRHRLWALMAIGLSIQLVFMATPQVRAWYAMFILPAFLLLPKGNVAKNALPVTLLFYIGTASMYASESPFEFNFIVEIFKSIQGTINN